MHKEILTKEQIGLLPVIKFFAKDFGLVGGTAIALYLGHRQSVDFDLFTEKSFSSLAIRKKILILKKIDKIFINQADEYSVLVDKVKITFFQYPFKIRHTEQFNNIIKMPDLLTLSAMKAYALHRRAKWKDYADLYFIMRDCYSVEKIIRKAKKIFGKEFNEKNFRTQLAYFVDIDYSEKIIYSRGFRVEDEIIKKELKKFSLEL